MSVSATDVAQIKRAEDLEKERERDWEWLMGQERGRRLLYGLMYDQCHVDRVSHVPGCSDSTAYNEGSRAVGQFILSKAMQYRDKYLLMLGENDG